MSFTANNVPELSGKTIVITGGNSGIGFEAARVIAEKKGRVVLACRDPQKMEAAAKALSSLSPQAQIDSVVLDLSSLASVREAAKVINQKYNQIDVLVNNAGVMALPFRETKNGFEMQFGTNHLGHFAFSGLVFDKVKASPTGRVVTVSSLLHRDGELRFDDIPKVKNYNEQTAYSMSKLANLLFAFELDRKCKASSDAKHVKSLGCHPGYSATNLQGAGPAMKGSKLMGLVMSVMNAVIAQPAATGALGTLRAAFGDDVEGGDYVGSVGMNGLRGPPERGTPSARSRDAAVAQKLWALSEELTQVRWQV